MSPLNLDDDELERDRAVIASATPGPWIVNYVDDDLFMNAITVSRENGSGELADHENNIAVVLLQSPRFSDVGDEHWDENAEFIARARTRWPEAIVRIAELQQKVDFLLKQNSDLRAAAS